MRLSHVLAIYFLMGTIVMGAGVVPPDQVGLAEQFITIDEDAPPGEVVQADDEAIEGEEDGHIHNLVGPIRNALHAFVPQLLAVWGAVSTFAGYFAWPVTVANYINAPWQVTAVMGVLVMSVVLGTLRVFRASI